MIDFGLTLIVVVIRSVISKNVSASQRMLKTNNKIIIFWVAKKKILPNEFYIKIKIIPINPQMRRVTPVPISGEILIYHILK